MKNGRIFAVILTIFVVTVNGRVYYLPSVEENPYTDLSYPVPTEQSSRDLDLSFLAGESDEFDNKIRPVKKMYTVVAPQKPFIEVNKETLPIMRYKLVEAPVKTINSDDVIVAPESNRKTVKTNGNNKGEVILELRVIANHDSVFAVAPKSYASLVIPRVYIGDSVPLIVLCQRSPERAMSMAPRQKDEPGKQYHDQRMRPQIEDY